MDGQTSDANAAPAQGNDGAPASQAEIDVGYATPTVADPANDALAKALAELAGETSGAGETAADKLNSADGIAPALVDGIAPAPVEDVTADATVSLSDEPAISDEVAPVEIVQSEQSLPRDIDDRSAPVDIGEKPAPAEQTPGKTSPSGSEAGRRRPALKTRRRR